MERKEIIWKGNKEIMFILKDLVDHNLTLIQAYDLLIECKEEEIK